MASEALIIDPSEDRRTELGAQLEAAFFTASVAPNVSAALVGASGGAPDVILLGGPGSVQTCRRIKATPLFAQTPVILITSRAGDRKAGFEAGADDFLSSPVDAGALVARIRVLARVRLMSEELRLRQATSLEFGLVHEDVEERPYELCIVAGADTRAPMWGAEAAKLIGARCTQVSSGLAAMKRLRADPPDAFLIGALPTGEDHGALCSAMAVVSDADPPAILVIGDDQGAEPETAMLDNGASDSVSAPEDVYELAARLRAQLKRKRYADRLRRYLRDGLRLSFTDELTGLFNRRYVDEHLSRRMAAASDTGDELSLIMFDVDRFKMINDVFGHGAGDRALQVFANRLKRNLRGVDMIARFGGEEFLVALPGVGSLSGCAAARRILEIAATPSPDAPHVTVSAGVAALRRGDDPAALIARADKALYAAKAEGRNCVAFEDECDQRQLLTAAPLKEPASCDVDRCPVCVEIGAATITSSRALARAG